MKLTNLICLLLITLAATAQKISRSAKEAAATITAADLKTHLNYIAGPETEGRATGSPGIEKAAQYIENKFKSLGLLPGNGNSYRVYYPLYQDSLLSASITHSGQVFENGKHFSVTTRSNENHDFEAEVVFAGYGIADSVYNDYNGLDVKGKIVLVATGIPSFSPKEPAKDKPANPNDLTGMILVDTNDSASVKKAIDRLAPWRSNTSLKLRAALDRGAKGVLFWMPSFSGNRVNNSRGSLYPAFMPGRNIVNIPQYTVGNDIVKKLMSEEDVTRLAELIKKQDPKLDGKASGRVRLQFSKERFEIKASNVIGLLPGTDLKDEYVVLTAHMDHLGKNAKGEIYYGADDDGSGTCAIMELAEAFAELKKQGKGPRRSIVFMTVSGEEMGLWGSAYYTRNPVFSLEKTTVNLNIDMIGRIGSDYTGKNEPDSMNYVYVIGDDKLSSDLRPLSEKANEQIKLKLDYRYNDPNDRNRFYYRSDHYNFAEKGVPIIFYFDGVHADYHRITDTPDKINYDLYQRRAQLVFFTGLLMANHPGMLKRDIPLNMPAR
jgi:hypothetical protein